MGQIFACYREFAPSDALRPYVRAIFSFAPYDERSPEQRPLLREVIFKGDDPFGSPLFADGQASLVFSFDKTCRAGEWQDASVRPHGIVIGPMSRVGPSASGDRAEVAGVYLRPAGLPGILGDSASQFTDRIVLLEDIWATTGTLAAELRDTGTSVRINRLESALLERIGRMRQRSPDIDVNGMAAWIMRQGGQLRAQDLSNAAGVSRQHLARVFRERVGVSPKLYCRLARFQSGLVYAGCGRKTDWARAAAEMGYADQSHMIAEFREFSSLTPQELGRKNWFHPFIERARATRQRIESR